MTPKVPMRESGIATLGMMGAQAVGRKANTTKITSRMEMMREISTSWTEARIVVVRSMATFRWSEGEMEARRKGTMAMMRSTVSIMFAPGCRKMAMLMPGFPLES